MHLGPRQDRRQHLGQKIGPAMRLFGGRDEVLTNLDQEPRESPRGDLLMQRIARQGAVIRLVVADDEAAVSQRCDQRLRQARIGVP